MSNTGHQETKIDQLNRGTDCFYDAAGRLTDIYLPAVDDALTTSTALVRPHWHYTYDANGNQSSQTDPKGNVTSFTYDELGHRLSRTLPSVSGTVTENWTFDSYGRTETHVDFKGQGMKYIYDNTSSYGGRLIEEQRFTGAVDSSPDDTTAYTYDDLGRKTSVNEYNGASTGTAVRTTTYGYDPITGGVILIDSPEGKVHHKYDQATGRLLNTWTGTGTDPTSTTSGAVVTRTDYEYDAQGRLWKAIGKKVAGTSGTVTLTTTYTYDAAGNLDTITKPNGEVTDYDYDTLNRLTHEVVAKSGGNKLFEQTYTLLNNGQRDYVIEKRYDGSSSTPFSTTKIDWSYDALNRLTGETRDEGNDATQNGGDYTDTYSFDLNGNRVTKTHDAMGTSSDETITSAYDARNRLSGTDSTVNANDATYAYDANGSTTSVTTSAGTKKYTWNLRNQMSGYDANGDNDTSDTGDATYGYDSDGNRVSKSIVGTGTTCYVVDANNPTGYAKAIEEKATTSSAPTRSYLFGLDVIGQSDATNGSVYLLKDGHGTTRALANSSGSVITITLYDYDAFGNALNFTASSAITTWLSPDGTYDVETGFTSPGARYNNRSLGRFISQDPIEIDDLDPSSPEMLHLYLYANANPIYYADSTGLTSEAEQMAVTGIQGMLQRISLAATRFVTTGVRARLASAFAAGGTAIGRAWNWLGQQVNDFAKQVINLFPQFENPSTVKIADRIIDFGLKAGDKLANLEVKYKIPARAGDSLNRLIGQMNAMATKMPGEQAVVWTLKEPTLAEMRQLQQAAGNTTFNQVQFVHGVEGLYHWIKLYFNLQ